MNVKLKFTVQVYSGGRYMCFIVKQKSIALMLFIVFMSLSQISINAQNKFSNTPAGKRGQQLLDVMNKKVDLNPKEFVRQNCSDSFKNRIPEGQWGGLINQLMGMSQNTELIKINKSKDYEVEFVIQLTSNKMYFTITLETEEASPNYILGMRFVPGGGAYW